MEIKVFHFKQCYFWYITIAIFFSTMQLSADNSILIGKITSYKSNPDLDLEKQIQEKLTEKLEQEKYLLSYSKNNELAGVSEAKSKKHDLYLDIYYSSKSNLKEFYILVYDPKDESLIDSIYYSSRFGVPEEIQLPEDEIVADTPVMLEKLFNTLIISIRSNPSKLESSENIEVNFLRTPLSKSINYKLKITEEGKKTEEIQNLLNPIQETASKRNEKITDASATMTIISRADIEKYGYKTLPEALARVPEVYVHYNGHNYSADFRGFFVNNVERRVLYMLNGHRLNDRFHFGDFYPDVINDLNNVERIEIIRGPGAAIYGNNAVLGVVNIITKKPTSDSPTTVLQEFSNIQKSSYISKTQVIHNVKYNNAHSFMFDINWYNGDIQYDTRTDWENSNGRPGIAKINYSTDAYFSVDRSMTRNSFTKGDPLPNFHLKYTYKDISLACFLYTRRATWVWPKDGQSFGSTDNDRVWGTGSIILNYKPTDNFLEKIDFSTSLSYNINTNRESAVYEYDKTAPPNGKLRDFTSDIFFIKDLSGQIVSYNKTIPPDALSKEAVLANGGGMKTQYHGLDRVLTSYSQISPIKNEILKLTLGLNLHYADYMNYQRYTYKNNVPIGFHPRGSIIDSGVVAGVWNDFLINPNGKLQLNLGARFDAQYIKIVRRHGGGNTFYYKDTRDDNHNWNTDEYLPKQSEKLYSQHISPRISINYYITPMQNLRGIYSEAFRAVTPQEVIRLTDSTSTAKPETTKSYELIYTIFIKKNIIVTSNGFHLKGSEIYAWTPNNLGFSRGTGWSNRGGSIMVQYIESMWEMWASFTKYGLERPVDAYHQYIRQDIQNYMPNRFMPLDSPTELIKGGGSYTFSNKLTIALEGVYNNAILQLYPTDEDYTKKSVGLLKHRVPASWIANLTLSKAWNNGITAMFQVSNLFQSPQWFGMNYDIESSFGSYSKPHQLPGFGRMFAFQVKYNF